MKPKPYIGSVNLRFNALIFWIPFCIVCVFIMAGMFSTIQRSSLYLPAYIQHSVNSTSTNFFMRVMGFENGYFVQDNPDVKNVSLSTVGLELATNVRMGDIRT
ncbi:MAG TPA: hypothetical protein VNM45_10130, partial [Bacillus sp. (in: firmicutes)]|nr:hypothetical protein [Bacillus sp. (in: firmicutes)]